MTEEEYAVTRARYPRLDLAKLLDPNRPPREWVIDGLFPAGASCSLVAPGGSGKSLFLECACCAIARGDRSFAGLAITKPRKVLYIDMENTEDDLEERFSDFGIRQENARQLDNLIYLHLPHLPALDVAEGGRELETIIDAYGLTKGDMVVLDSTQRVIRGAENDSDTMRHFYLCTGVMLKRKGLTAIRTDNTGHTEHGRARGSSGKKDDVDLELILKRDGHRVTIRPEKLRLREFHEIVFELQRDDDGRIAYSTGRDPWQAKISAAIDGLNRINAPLDISQRKAAEQLIAHGIDFSRDALRVAIKRRADLDKSARAATRAPTKGNDLKSARATNPRTSAHPPESATSRRENRANGKSAHSRADDPAGTAQSARVAGVSIDPRTAHSKPQPTERKQ